MSNLLTVMTALVRDDTDLTLRQMAVLGQLVENNPGGTSVRELSAHLSVAKPIITRAHDKLVAHKLVTRRPDTGDRRLVVIAPTAKGRAFWNKAAALADGPVVAKAA